MFQLHRTLCLLILTTQLYFLHTYFHIFYHLEIVENTLYKDHGASVRFIKFNNILAKQFPLQKLEDLKFSLISKYILLMNHKNGEQSYWSENAKS